MLQESQTAVVEVRNKVEPCVTVVLCCYSHERYFLQALQSILAQTVEVTCVILNNGASPSYTDLINRTAQMHGLGVISVEKNTYGLSLREKVLPFVRSEYLAILHDDDLYLPRKIEKSLQALKDDLADYVITNVSSINELGATWHGQSDAVNTHPLTGEDSRGTLIADMIRPPGCRMHFSTFVMRTDLVHNNLLGDPFWPRIADAFFWVDQLLDETVKLTIVTESLSKVRIHGGNDRLYTKFNEFERAKQSFLLATSEMALISRVLNRGSDSVIIDFLSSFTGVKMRDELVECLVLAAAIMDQCGDTYWFSKQYMISLLVHRAFEIDGLRACEQIQRLTGRDANLFMQGNYDRFITSMLTSATAAISAASSSPLPAIARMGLLEKYRTAKVTPGWVWRQPRKALARAFYAVARWISGQA